jgi:hypothetical protein|tara:strand:+ start:471 stop:914 length:444 start_codon:yes stop_codon:yes gene_type:complete
MTIFLVCSGLLADDVSDVEGLINEHWKTQNEKNWQGFVSTLHSGGTMNGDSNGSFWYRQDATVKAVTKNQIASNRFDFTPRYIEVDILEEDKYAVAYYYLVGSYTINGLTKPDYRTRVCQVLVKEGKNWKIKSGDFTPLHSGSGIPD